MNDDDDFERIAAEAQWLIENPQFEEKPASIEEFLGERYLNIERGVRAGIKQALVDVFGEEVQTNRIAKYEKAMLTGAIGIGKSTFASIALPYMVHWVLCLKDPQEYFKLLPGSRIAFMMMSTSERQARDVIFTDVFERIKHSKWFMEKYPYDDKYTKVIKFPKNVWILPGDSKETTFEGYNILGGILDEMDSHTVTKDKDYADVGYNTIEGRMRSRFGRRGLIIPIGQMKKATGFAARKYAEFQTDPDAFTVRMTLWESHGWEWEETDLDGSAKKIYLDENGQPDYFYYDFKRRQFIPKGVGDMLPDSQTIIKIPKYYEKDFRNRPEKSLKDLAGIPPAVSDPFISLVDKIELCRDRWIEDSFPGAEIEPSLDLSEFSPVTYSSHRPEFAPWFTNKAIMDRRRRVIHIDIAYSSEGDALGMAMGHIAGIANDDDEDKKPIIKFDFLLRIKAPAGTEIILGDVRRIIYYVRDELKFRISKVTYDGFESTDSVQQLRKKRIDAEKVSMDKSTLPYEDLRDAIYEERIMFPPYITEINRGDVDRVEIAIKELSELQDTGRKVDHPPTGSKDVADAMAGVTHELIGDRRYARGVLSLDVARQQRAQKTGTDDAFTMAMPDPTSSIGTVDDMLKRATEMGQPGSGFGITIPQHLRSR